MKTAPIEDVSSRRSRPSLSRYCLDEDFCAMRFPSASTWVVSVTASAEKGAPLRGLPEISPPATNSMVFLLAASRSLSCAFRIWICLF